MTATTNQCRNSKSTSSAESTQLKSEKFKNFLSPFPSVPPGHSVVDEVSQISNSNEDTIVKKKKLWTQIHDMQVILIVS